MFKPIRNFIGIILWLFIASLIACSGDIKEKEISLEAYQIEDGFQLEVVASEPLITAPVAMDFDDQSRIWVVEMNGYMPDIDGTNEEEPNGRIVILEDHDGDGRMDHTKVFLDQLVLPRALAHVYGGLLYAEPPNLWFVEIENDRPGKRTLVDSTYVVGGNVEHQPNGLLMNIDNWIYSAKSTVRYRRQNGQWKKEETEFRGQWGITHDDFGRLFYNDNSNPLYWDWMLPNQFNRNPYFKPELARTQWAKDRRVYPLHATAVNRGYIEGTLDEENKLKTMTSVCGPLIYRGDQFPDEYYGNAFICAPEVNLIKRMIVHRDGRNIMANQTWEGKEFLASTDEAFRPVNLYNGLDGNIYLVDMHRGVIQHKTYMSSYLRDQLVERGLDTLAPAGRILKVTHGKNQSAGIDFSDKSNLELVQLLNHKNGWVRNRAQQLIINRKATGVIDSLKKLVSTFESPATQIQALWALEGLDAINIEFLNSLVKTNNPEVLCTVIRLAEGFDHASDFNVIYFNAVKRKGPLINLQLALSIGKMHDKAWVVLQELVEQYPKDTLLFEAAISSLSGKEESCRNFLTAPWRGMKKDHLFIQMLDQTIENRNNPDFLKKPEQGFDAATEGLKLYRTHCESCHGPDGKGIENLAPPLYHSEYLEGDPTKLILLTLHGLKGPVTVNGKRYEMNAVMPGVKDNPEITDQEIAAILKFIRNGFGKEPRNIQSEEVTPLRKVLPKDGMYTEQELMEN